MAASDIGTFDYIIVGGGSAGCVVANRLSADPEIRVLLIEAGPDFEPGQEPEAIADRGFRSLMLHQYYWHDIVVSNRHSGATAPYPQARVIGGGSSINGMHGQRGLARDYDEWRQLGVQGWGWDDVLPYFKRMETDHDIRDENHGADGPVSVCRVPEDRWSPLTLALRRVFDGRGVPRLKDANAGHGDGTMATTLSNTATARSSSAAAYLTRDVRARPNLLILANTKVSRILLDDRTVSGIALDDGRTIRSANVFVCAGALQTPTMLMRSGIGPASDLNHAGIGLVADRAGVGANLLSHPTFVLASHLRRAGRQADLSLRPPVPMLVRYSSGHPGCPASDMQINLWERNPGPLRYDPLNQQISWLMILMQKTYSTGRLQLDPSAPDRPARIDFNMLDDDRDLGRALSEFRYFARLLMFGELAPLVHETFVPNLMLGKAPDALTMTLLSDTRKARLLSGLGAFALDYVPGARPAIMRWAGRDVREIVAMPDAELAEFLKCIVNPSGHPAGTCRMGDPTRDDTVLDSRCRVIGVDGLRVVDASIFPTLMNGGTNFPVLMAAEKAAAMAIEDRRA